MVGQRREHDDSTTDEKTDRADTGIFMFDKNGKEDITTGTREEE